MDKKSKKEKKVLSKEEKKIIKWLKVVVVLCIAILVLEGAYIGLKIYKRAKNTVYIETLSTAELVDNGYVSVGSSDFKYSKFNKYNKENTKAKITKYDQDYNIKFETAYTKGYASYFNDVETYEDGYVAVGAVQSSKEQIEKNVTDALIVLYDKNGKQKKEKTLQIVGNTIFTKVKQMDDGFLVLGQSILENLVLGTDPNGGGIMIKYDKNLNEVWRVNYGGSKSGIFNDAYIEEDAIYVVGKDATRYGIFVKYDKDGNRQFVKNYEYTDTVGFSAIDKMNDDYVVVGSKTVNIDAEDKDKETVALIVKYDQDGNVLFEKTYKKNKNARFNGVKVINNEIIAVGHTYKKDEKESTDQYNVFRYSGLIAKYDRDGNKIFETVEEGSRDTYCSDIVEDDGKYLIVGQTSSKELGSNNKDFKPYFLYYSKDGKKEQFYS